MSWPPSGKKEFPTLPPAPPETPPYVIQAITQEASLPRVALTSLKEESSSNSSPPNIAQLNLSLSEPGSLPGGERGSFQVTSPRQTDDTNSLSKSQRPKVRMSPHRTSLSTSETAQQSTELFFSEKGKTKNVEAEGSPEIPVHRRGGGVSRFSVGSPKKREGKETSGGESPEDSGSESKTPRGLKTLQRKFTGKRRVKGGEGDEKPKKTSSSLGNSRVASPRGEGSSEIPQSPSHPFSFLKKGGKDDSPRQEEKLRATVDFTLGEEEERKKPSRRKNPPRRRGTAEFGEKQKKDSDNEGPEKKPNRKSLGFSRKKPPDFLKYLTKEKPLQSDTPLQQIGALNTTLSQKAESWIPILMDLYDKPEGFERGLQKFFEDLKKEGFTEDFLRKFFQITCPTFHTYLETEIPLYFKGGEFTKTSLYEDALKILQWCLGNRKEDMYMAYAYSQMPESEVLQEIMRILSKFEKIIEQKVSPDSFEGKQEKREKFIQEISLRMGIEFFFKHYFMSVLKEQCQPYSLQMSYETQQGETTLLTFLSQALAHSVSIENHSPQASSEEQTSSGSKITDGTIIEGVIKAYISHLMNWGRKLPKEEELV